MDNIVDKLIVPESKPQYLFVNLLGLLNMSMTEWSKRNRPEIINVVLNHYYEKGYEFCSFCGCDRIFLFRKRPLKLRKEG